MSHLYRSTVIFLGLFIGFQLGGLDWAVAFRQASPVSPGRQDFLIDDSKYVAEVQKTASELVMQNGLIRRTWRLTPNGACVAFDNLFSGKSMLRSVRPEARVNINGVAYEIGGLKGQPNQAFLTARWLEQMKADPAAFRLLRVEIGKPQERIEWKQRRHHGPNLSWPPKGAYVQMVYQLKALSEVRVIVHYEMYDGLPAMSKWITIENGSPRMITVDRFRSEELAVVEHTNWVELRGDVQFPQPDYLHVETDFAFGGFNFQNANRHVVSWQSDPNYITQVNYLKKSPCLLVVEPTYGPSQEIEPGGVFESFRTFELAYDSSERERQGLTLRKMYRTLAPWVTENPITHHLLKSKPADVRKAIDHAADVGFEAVILSFGSGFNMESTDDEYLKNWTDVASYAEAKGVELGGYSLFSSRSVGNGNDVVSPEGESPTFGRAPSATSEWGIEYYQKLKRFFDHTGFDQFENDGPYPGDVDVTQRLPYQKGIRDSRWAQWKIVVELYRHLRATGVYINQPDYYFMNGGNKTGMGYREVNWSLPREQQVIHTRQNIFDGTWTKTPSMGWMHVPLAQYHGGGAAATIEPLHQHLDHYERMMMSNFGMGVQAHYRGPRLFDTVQTKAQVKKLVDWFKEYRNILESDMIHCRRADGRDLDWVLHVNPKLGDKGMLCVWNPLPTAIRKTLRLNLYYTGLKDVAMFSNDDSSKSLRLSRDYFVDFEVNVAAEGMQWFVIR